MSVSDAPQDERRRVVVGELLREGGTVLRVCGRCMEPGLPDGWSVRYRVRRPWPGDVVVLIDGLGRTLVHRYLGSRPWFDRENRRWRRLAVTRADVADRFDPEVPRERIVGVVGEVGSQGEWISRRTRTADRVRAARLYGGYLLLLLRRGFRRWLDRDRTGH